VLSFKAIPFLRIIIPFLAGIYFGVEFYLAYNAISLIILLGLSIILLSVFGRRIPDRSGKIINVLVFDLFLFFSALYSLHIYNITNHASYYGQYVNGNSQNWTGKVIDLPQEKENFYKVRIAVQRIENGPASEPSKGEVMAYIRKPFNADQLKPGIVLAVQSRFAEVPLPKNPYEFNYRNYLARKNIYYQSFISAENILTASPHHAEFSLSQWGLELKQSIIERFKNSNLNEEAKQLCIALITGYDEDVSAETINAFAHSGTLHVLSVSGLHTGVLYAVLIFFIGLIDRHKKYKGLHVLCVVAMLFLLSLVTGFSPPVLRASIMLTLIMIGKYYFNYSANNSMNVIAVSAFIILLAEPFLLYDAGFLLSYLAVIGIIYFEPFFSSLINFDNVILSKAWKLSSVSLAAQLGTLPVTLYLFHQFPLWFIFSNLIVIPLCAVVMILAFLVLFKLNLVSVLINAITELIWFTIHLTDKRGIGYIDRIDFTMTDVLFMSALIFFFSFAIKFRSYRFLAGSLLMIIAWQCLSIFESFSDKSRSVIGIYHASKQSVVEIKNGTSLELKMKNNEKAYDFHVKPNHSSYNYFDLSSSSPDYVRSEKISFFHLTKPDHQALVKFLLPDVVLISEEPDIDPGLLAKVRPKLLIADGANGYGYLKKLKETCSKLEIPFYSTKENGYLQLDL
jgi:competence protein ComEC